MPIHHSIFDLDVSALKAYNFSKPLFVQACRPHLFDETVDVLHHRLALRREDSTLLTTATYPARPAEAARRIVRQQGMLSERTVVDPSAPSWSAYSLVVVVAPVSMHDEFLAMRDFNNLACFAHALEPRRVLFVNGDGHFKETRQLFRILERNVGNVVLTGNTLISDAETQALFEATRARRAGCAVEVGRFGGGSAMVMAAAARQAGSSGITSVDLVRLPAAEYFIRSNGLEDDIELIDGDSVEVARQWQQRPAKSISMLFIDADHSYDGVVRDLASWTPYLADGATLVLHDTGLLDTGVAKAAYYFVHSQGYENHRMVDSMLFCERRRAA